VENKPFDTGFGLCYIATIHKPTSAAMTPKQLTSPTKFERAPALGALRTRLREQQHSKVMARSPAVKEMKRTRVS